MATKIAVSVPEDLYRSIEQNRKITGKTRSAVVQEALHAWLQRERERILIRRYEAGYRIKPETRREIKAAESAAVRLLSSQEW